MISNFHSNGCITDSVAVSPEGHSQDFGSKNERLKPQEMLTREHGFCEQQGLIESDSRFLSKSGTFTTTLLFNVIAGIKSTLWFSFNNCINFFTIFALARTEKTLMNQTSTSGLIFVDHNYLDCRRLEPRATRRNKLGNVDIFLAKPSNAFR